LPPLTLLAIEVSVWVRVTAGISFESRDVDRWPEVRHSHVAREVEL
jgi:hypothetical protein